MKMKKKVMVFPCSGIGKVSGTIARETSKKVVKENPKKTEGPCLALLTVGDEETVRKVKENPSIAIDGCPKACALKNIEKSGGKVTESFMVLEYMKEHKNMKPGTVTALTKDGEKLVDLISKDVSAKVDEIMGGVE